MKITQQIKNRASIWSNNFISWHLSTQNTYKNQTSKICIHTSVHVYTAWTHCSTQDIETIWRRKKEWMNKELVVDINTLKCYAIIIIDAILHFAAFWMELGRHHVNQNMSGWRGSNNNTLSSIVSRETIQGNIQYQIIFNLRSVLPFIWGNLVVVTMQ